MASKRKKMGSNDTGGSPATGHRDWSELPDLPLLSVLDRLPSLADLFAFAGVCRSWRSLSKSTAGRASLASRPPLLLRPVLRSPDRRPHWRQWTNPARCRLDTPIDESVSYRCMLSSSTLSKSCIGSSFGNLIFLGGRRPLIANALTGDEIRPPNLPPDRQVRHCGFLTAPPSSSDCRLLLTSTNSTLLCWRVGGQEWSKHPLGRHVVPPIQQVLVFEGRVYALDFGGRLLTIQFSPQLSVDFLEDRLGWKVVPRPLPITNLAQPLLECGGELLLVRFVHPGHIFRAAIEVYRLDSSLASWVKVESLGDWSLFVDVTGRCPVSCVNPARWGGRSNCIYVVGPGCDSWSIFPLDGTLVDCLSLESPLRAVYSVLPSWPSPLWVYPSMLF